MYRYPQIYYPEWEVSRWEGYYIGVHKGEHKRLARGLFQEQVFREMLTKYQLLKLKTILIKMVKRAMGHLLQH